MSEKEKLCQAVDEFAEAMKARLLQKQKQGFHGWYTDVYDQSIRSRLFEKAGQIMIRGKNIGAKHLVDVANFAMMLWRRTRA